APRPLPLGGRGRGGGGGVRRHHVRERRGGSPREAHPVGQRSLELSEYPGRRPGGRRLRSARMISQSETAGLGAPSPSKTSLYVQLARPFTLLPPLLGIISGAVCAFGSVHNPDREARLTLSVVLTVALGSLCASFMNAASNAINQIYDLEIDRLNKPNRPLVTGALSVREVWVFSWIFYALALIPTWLVVA